MCRKSVTSSDQPDTMRAWCTLSGLVARTPKRSSRTSQPWQNGQCSTSRPYRSATPGTSGSSSLSPVVTISRRACTVSPPASLTAKLASRDTSTARSRTSSTP
ncbi:hypothetical protein RKD31_001463 [Streptomyces sp. SAI-163]